MTLLAAAPLEAQADGSTPAKKTNLERAAEAVAYARSAMAAAGEVWPKFRFRHTPIAIYETNGVAWLFQHPSPPTGFVQIQGNNYSGVLRGPATGMQANTAAKIGGHWTALVGIDSLSSQGTSDADAALVIHEAFHVFQRSSRVAEQSWPMENSILVSRYPVSDPPNNAWGRVEGRILRSAVTAPSASDRNAEAARFLTVRRHRAEKLPEPLRVFEERLELNEGLADYVAIRTLRAGKGTLWHRLLDRLERINVGGRDAARLRFYSTGAAQAFLLDRVSPGWQVEFQKNGGTLTTILAAAIRKEVGHHNPDEGLRRIRLDEQIDSLIEQERALAAATERKNLRSLWGVLAADERKLVLVGGRSKLTVARFDPMNLTATAGVRVHTRMASFRHVLDQETATIGFSQSVVEDLRRNRLITLAPEDLRIEIGGDLVEKSMVDRVGRVTIAGTGLRATIPSGRVLLESDVVRVFLDGAQPEPTELDNLRGEFEAARRASRAPWIAPRITCTDMRGRATTFPRAGVDNTTLLFFSAAKWATPARKFAEAVLRRLANSPQSPNRRVILIATQTTREELQQFMREGGLKAETIPIVLDTNRELATLYEAGALPVQIWINGAGAVEWREKGFRPQALEDFMKRVRAR